MRLSGFRALAAMLGLVTAFCASDLSAKSGSKNAARIAAQKAAKAAPVPATEGELTDPDDPLPAQPKPSDEALISDRPQDPQLLSRGEMMSLAGKYEADIDNAIAHVEGARANAYRDRDVIKLTCIEEKLVQMKMLSQTVAPRFKVLAKGRDDFSVRAEFVVIAPAWQHMNELRDEVEVCVGEMLDTVAVVSVAGEIPDPTGPDFTDVPPPKVNAERVPEASPYK